MDTPNSTTFKRCPKCGESKPSTAEYFYRKKKRPDGLGVWCKACCSASGKQWYKANRDRVIASSKAWQEANRERKSETYRVWKEANQDALRDYHRNYRIANRDTLQERRRARYKTNPDLFFAGKHRRFARKRSLPGAFTAEDWQIALDHFGGCCAVCGRPPGLWHTIAADHWIPLNAVDCPGTVPWNMVPLCHGIGGCNNSKADRNAAEWLIAKFGKRKGLAIQRRIETFFNSRRKQEQP